MSGCHMRLPSPAKGARRIQIGKYLPDGRTALCFLETQSHVYATCLRPYDKGICIRMSHHSHHSVWPCAVTLLFLISIVLCYLGLQEQSFRAVFRLNVYL